VTYEFFHVSPVLVGDAATSVLSNMLPSVLKFDVISSERRYPSLGDISNPRHTGFVGRASDDSAVRSTGRLSD
jgi:hypothetical protein